MHGKKAKKRSCLRDLSPSFLLFLSWRSFVVLTSRSARFLKEQEKHRKGGGSRSSTSFLSVNLTGVDFAICSLIHMRTVCACCPLIYVCMTFVCDLEQYFSFDATVTVVVITAFLTIFFSGSRVSWQLFSARKGSRKSLRESPHRRRRVCVMQRPPCVRVKERTASARRFHKNSSSDEHTVSETRTVSRRLLLSFTWLAPVVDDGLPAVSLSLDFLCEGRTAGSGFGSETADSQALTVFSSPLTFYRHQPLFCLSLSRSTDVPALNITTETRRDHETTTKEKKEKKSGCNFTARRVTFQLFSNHSKLTLSSAASASFSSSSCVWLLRVNNRFPICSIASCERRKRSSLFFPRHFGDQVHWLCCGPAAASVCVQFLSLVFGAAFLSKDRSNWGSKSAIFSRSIPTQNTQELR